jgi:hypothetical protein
VTRTEKTTLGVKKTELFIQAADPWLQEKLEPLLEDCNEELGLKSDWKGLCHSLPRDKDRGISRW